MQYVLSLLLIHDYSNADRCPRIQLVCVYTVKGEIHHAGLTGRPQIVELPVICRLAHCVRLMLLFPVMNHCFWSDSQPTTTHAIEMII